MIKASLCISGLLFFWAVPLMTFGQEAHISGIVKDARTNETLVGVNIVADSLNGISTDVEGRYHLSIPHGDHIILFSYVGYLTRKIEIHLEENEVRQIDVKLEPEIIELDMAVISAGKFEQKLSDVTVSMEVIKPDYIQRTNTVNMESVISQMPGVDVIDGQANIRGGSGYSYGAGSRVMVLVDDLPILTADVNEVKWNFLPVENIGNVEILKGASSSLYGSSALNGVINIRTAQPGTVPHTEISVFSGVYMKPVRKELAWWWDSNPIFTGVSFSHLRQIGNVDLVTGAYAFSDAGYREDDYEERIRFNIGFRHRPRTLQGFSYGVNTNVQYQNSSDFMIWIDADSGAYMQQPDAVSPTEGLRFNIDPYIDYYDSRGHKHSLKTRFYKVYNVFDEDPDKDNGSDLYYGEYQFQKDFRKGLHWTIGISGSYGNTDAELYGDHYSSTMAIYTQADQKFGDRLSASLGLRWERYTLDRTDDESQPVVRAGLNYEVAEYSFIRASFGQGYRFPSIAEKYTATSLGSLNIFPNPDLKPETGWSTEIGFKQGIRLGTWTGYLDVAGFWMEYQEMMEFTFGVYMPDTATIPTLDDVGFKSLNIGQARITGIDMSAGGSGYIAAYPVHFFVGYTYMDPIDMSSDTLEDNMLKYRYHHSVKGDIQYDINAFSIGLSLVYTSFIERIDAAFEEKILGQEIFRGLKQYREENAHGAAVFDLRCSYQFTAHSRVSVLVKNLFNKEYMGRPGDLQPPCNLSIQYLLSL
jgi:iron complex outermembrane receptor protein